jgi:hypothetical protein
MVSGGKPISASRSALLAAFNQDEMCRAIGRRQEHGNDQPVLRAIEGVALIGLATLLGVALTLVVENMGRRLL